MQPSSRRILVSVADQRLKLLDGVDELRSFPVSTSFAGTGFGEGSLKTPTGRFRIAEKIGYGQPHGMVFRSRRPTGEVRPDAPGEDLVLSRILWLDGLEEENANTKSRFIYIHGTNHEEEIGAPCSHGCVRMRNPDVIELFDLVDEGAEVEIR